MVMTQQWDYRDEELPRLCAELGSISAVARHLQIPRPSISAHINKVGNEALKEACQRALITGEAPVPQSPSEALRTPPRAPGEASTMQPPPWQSEVVPPHADGKSVRDLEEDYEAEQELNDLRQWHKDRHNEKLEAQARERRIMEKLDKIRRRNNTPLNERPEHPRTPPPSPTVQGAGPRTDPQVDAIRREAMERFRAKSQRVEQKKNQHVRFPHGPVALVFCGDQHIGNAGTDIERMFREQEIIMGTPGAYVVQMGDISDNFIVGKLMAENMKPALPVWEQWELAQFYLHQWEDRIIAFCGGNHNAWTLKVSGIDYQRDICPDGILYDGDELRFNIHVGDGQQFRVMARHKWRGQSQYNPTQGIERSAKLDNPDFDIYAGAHIHQGAVAREFIHNQERKMSLLSGAYKVHDDYAIQEGFGPSDASTATAVVLHDDGSFFGCSDLYAVSHYMHAVYPQ